MATHVHATDTSPSFTYTAGLWATKGLPELIVFGLDMERAHGAFSTIIKEAEHGNRLKTGVPVNGLFSGVHAALFATDQCKHAEFMLFTTWFYDHPGFPAEQLVLPDQQGSLPWEKECEPAFIEVQPDLTPSGWTSALVGPWLI
jgi:hypothetical protein